jgi:hypothetical protein
MVCARYLKLLKIRTNKMKNKTNTVQFQNPVKKIVERYHKTYDRLVVFSWFPPPIKLTAPRYN